MPPTNASNNAADPSATASLTAPPISAASDAADSARPSRDLSPTERAEALLRTALATDETSGQTTPPEAPEEPQGEIQEEPVNNLDAASPEQATPDDEADEDGDASNERKDWPDSARKRVGKLTARLRETERALEADRQRLAQLDTELQDARTAAPAAPAAPSGLDSFTSQQLSDLEAAAKTMDRHIEKYLEGVANKAETAAVTGYMEREGLEGEVELKRRRLELRDLVHESIPARRSALKEFESAQAQHNEKAAQLFPYWNDRSSSDYQAAMSVVQALPALRSRPDWRIVASTYVLGLRALKDIAGKKNGTAAPSPARIPPKPPAAAAAPIRVPSADASRQAARTAALTSRNPKAVHDWVASELEAVGIH